MKHSRLLLFAGLTALSAAAACSDIVSPNRSQRYDWRLVVNYDSAGLPLTDTLSFHWPRNHGPVKVWAQDQDGLRGHIDQAIGVWRNAFLYNEWDGTLVSDSSEADVIVLATLPPPSLRQTAARINGMAESCGGATDVDTASTRFELKVPIRSYVFVEVPGAPDLEDCLARVATHEIGHTLGLFQHSTDSLDLMFSFPSRLFLTDRDLGAAYNAYHFPSDMVPARFE
jgi:predicted Zn-dependent protease